MTTCKIILEKDPKTLKAIPGRIKTVKAPNGKRSFLFDTIREHLTKEVGNSITREEADAQALENYYKVYTNEFKSWFGDWEVSKKLPNTDENGEPKLIDKSHFINTAGKKMPLFSKLSGAPRKITSDDRVVFGHPTIGKSWLKKQGNDQFISLDDDFIKEIEEARDGEGGIIDTYKDQYAKENDGAVLTKYQVQDGGTKPWNTAYNEMMQDLYEEVKAIAIEEGKSLLTSNTRLLKNNIDDFDKVVNIPTDTFIERVKNDRPNAKYDIEEWKSQINEVVSQVPLNKVITTDGYLSELIASPEENREIVTSKLDINPTYKGKIIFASSGIGKSFAKGLNDSLIDSDQVYASILGVSVAGLHDKLVSLTNEERTQALDSLRESLLDFAKQGFTVLTPTEKMLDIADHAFIQGNPEKMAANTRNEDRENPYQQSVVEAKQRINRYKRNIKRAGLAPVVLDKNNYLANYLFKEKEPIKMLAKNANNELNQKLVSYLANFGVSVRELENIQEALKIDSLGFADILNKIAYLDKTGSSNLPKVTGTFIAHMMQYNPLVTDVYNDLRKVYPQATKKQLLEEIGNMISNRLLGKKTTAKDLSERGTIIRGLTAIVELFRSLLRNVDFRRLNKNIGEIAQGIVDDNVNMVTASKFKPGAQGKPVTRVNFKKALEKDSFATSIVDNLADKSFILTGSVTLSEQGTIYRPDENQVHDLDWVSPYDRSTTKFIFKKVYPEAIFIRDIVNDDYITDTFLIAPDGYEIQNLVKKGDRNIVMSYDVVNKETGVIEGDYKLVDNAEVTEGVEAKTIDFFSYEVLNEWEVNTMAFVELKSGKQLPIAEWDKTFRAKLEFGRLKDIWDYNRFIPKESFRNLIDNAEEYSTLVDKEGKGAKVKDRITIPATANITDYRNMTKDDKNAAVAGNEQAQLKWMVEEVNEFYEAVDSGIYNDIADEAVGLIRTAQHFNENDKVQKRLSEVSEDISKVFDTRKDFDDGFDIWLNKKKKNKPNQYKSITEEGVTSQTFVDFAGLNFDENISYSLEDSMSEEPGPKGQTMTEIPGTYQIDLNHFEMNQNQFGYSSAQLQILKRYNEQISSLIREGKTSDGTPIVDGKVEVDLDDTGLPWETRRILKKRGVEKITLYASTSEKGFVMRRVTMAQDINYLKKRSEEDIKAQEENPKSQLSKEMGTKMHNINESVLKAVVEDKSGVFNVTGQGDMHMNLNFSVWNQGNSKLVAFKSTTAYKKLLTDAKTVFKKGDDKQVEQMLDKLILSMLGKYHAIHVTQHQINVEHNKGIKDKSKHVFHKPIILIEKPLLDKHVDEAGTMDLLVIYSDKSAGIFDHKFTDLKLERVDLKKSGLTRDQLYAMRKKQGLPMTRSSANDWVYMLPTGKNIYEKEESWNLQIGRYSQMLMKLYGIKNIRQARILPVHTQYELLKTGKKKKTKDGKQYDEKIYSVDKSKVEFILTGDDAYGMSEIPLEVERTGDQSLDQFIASLISQKKRLNKEMIEKKAWSDPKYTDRISKLDQSIKGLLKNRDVKYIVNSIESLAKNIEQSLNPDDGIAITFEDITDYMHEAGMYDAFIGATSKEIKKMKEREEALIAGGETIPVEESYITFERNLADATTNLKFLTESLRDKMVSMLASVNQEHGYMSDAMFKSFDKQTDMTKIGVYGTQLSDSNHPLVSMFAKMLDEVNTRKIKSTQQLEKELTSISKDLKEWGNKQGLKGSDIYSIMINKHDNLIRKYTKDMREDMKAHSDMTTDGPTRISNVNWFKNNFKRSERGSRIFAKKLDGVIAHFQRITDTKEEYAEKLEDWLNRNDVTHNGGDNNAWGNTHNHFMLEPIKPELYHSDEYKVLLNPSNKPALKFYNFYTDQMMKLESQVDFTIQEGFIPEIRKNFMDTVVQDGFFTGLNQQKRNLFNFFLQHDKDQGFQDLENGKKVPIFFMDSVGKGNKSLDLHKSLIIFSDFVQNYSGSKDVEHMALSMKHLIDTTSGIQRGRWGRKMRDEGNTPISNVEQGGNKNLMEAFDTWVDYYVYGIKQKGDKNTTNKVVDTVLGIGSRKNIAMNWISAAAGHVNGEAQTTMLAKKGFNMTEKSLKEARKIVKGRGSKLEILRSAKAEVDGVTSKFGFVSMFFEMSQEDLTHEVANKMSLSDMRRKWSRDYAYFMQRWSDDVIDNTILITMMKDYAIDPNTGKAYPISKLERVYKDHPQYGGDFEWISLWESTDMDHKEGETPSPIIKNQHTGEAITDKTYTDFRTKARKVVAKAKGQMSSDDIAGYKTHMIGKLAMQYRGWMPATIRERSKGEEYNLAMEQFEVGRWLAGYHMLGKNLSRTWQDFLKLLTPFMNSDLQVIDNSYMQNEYSNFIADNPHLEPDEANPSPDQVSYEEYIETYKGEVRALAREVQTYLGLLAAWGMFSLAMGDDELKENPIAAKTSLLLERAMLEIGFFTPGIGIIESIKMFKRAPFPAISVIDDAVKTASNTVTETIDLLNGTPWNRTSSPGIGDEGWEFGFQERLDRTPAFYYSSQWIPGGKSVGKFLGIFGTTKRNDTFWDWMTAPTDSEIIYK